MCLLWERQCLHLPFIKLVVVGSTHCSVTQSTIWVQVLERPGKTGNFVWLTLVMCSDFLLCSLCICSNKHAPVCQREKPGKATKEIPACIQMSVARGRKKVFLPLTYNKREEINQSIPVKQYKFYQYRIPSVTLCGSSWCYPRVSQQCPPMVDLSWELNSAHFALQGWAAG